MLANRYEGKRFNSPNDLVYRADGALVFTDPPFGLPKVFDDTRKELAFSGVYMPRNGAVSDGRVFFDMTMAPRDRLYRVRLNVATPAR